jgi:hypothetical protein
VTHAAQELGSTVSIAVADWPPGTQDAALPRVRFTSCHLTVAGQRLNVVPGSYDWIYLALTWATDMPGSPAVDEVVWLHYRDVLDPEYLRAVPGAGTFGPGATLARVGVARRDELLAVVLPNRPYLRMIALGLGPAAAEEHGRAR